jgi:hypothetical protein
MVGEARRKIANTWPKVNSSSATLADPRDIRIRAVTQVPATMAQYTCECTTAVRKHVKFGRTRLTSDNIDVNKSVYRRPVRRMAIPSLAFV